MHQTQETQEITIGHNMLVHVVYTYNNYTGGTGVKEPSDLHGSDHRRPDLQMVVNNTHILTDIQITNPLCPTHVHGSAQQQLHAAQLSERTKTKKYEETAKQHDAKFVPFIMEATGGMSKSAKQIYEMIILASRDNGTLWPHDIIARDFRGAIAIAVQRRNAMTMIAGRWSGNRTSCHLCSSIKCYVFVYAQFNLVFLIYDFCVH